MRKFIAAATGAAFLATTFAAPAEAGRRHHRHHDDVDAGDVIAGAVVIGGLAALASAIGTGASREKQDAAVDNCSREAESRLDGRVTHIANVSKRKGYYTIDGEIEGGLAFSCTIRNGSIYSFRGNPAEA